LKPGCDQLFRAARNHNQACKRGARRAGEVYSVRYEAVNAMLLNEFLKEHRKLQEQGAIIAEQQKQIDALTAGLQKVSARLEASKPASQTVLNNQ
jgi:hypothetical protein